MDHSLNQLADQILNAVYAGLKGPANFSISREQIKDELIQARNRNINESAVQGIFQTEPYLQTIPKLSVVKKDFSGVSGYSTNRQEYFTAIPELLYPRGVKPIAYVTAMDKAFTFKILYGNDFLYYKHDRYSSKKPSIWVRDKELWLFNPPIANIQWITLRGLFENPRSLNGISGLKINDDSPFPAPGSLMDQIRNKMVYDYINNYRKANMLPTLLAGDMNFTTEKSK